MPAYPLTSMILWGSNYENQLLVGRALFDVVTDRPPHPLSQTMQLPSLVEDSWIVPGAFTLWCTARWVPDNTSATGFSPLSGALGWQRFIDWARQKNPFRFVPDATWPLFYVDQCYLVDTFKGSGLGKMDDILLRDVPFQIRNATVDFHQALRGIMFEYAPGDVIADPAFGASFTRGGGCDFIDNNGLVQQAPDATLRDRHYINGQRVTALQATRTNLVIQSDALSTGWTVEAGLAVTPAYAMLGILAMSRITGLTLGAVYRTVTLTGNGPKAFSCIVQYDGVTGVTHHGLFDNTASAWLALAAVTWASDGTATCVANNGILLAFEKLGLNATFGYAYRIVMQSASATAAHTHLLYATNQGSTTATSVRVAAMDVQDNAVPAIEPIPTGAAPVTYNTERLTFAFPYVPQPMWWYVKFIERGTILAGLTQGVLGIGDSVAPSLFLYETGTYGFQHRALLTNVVEAAGAAPNYGDTVELLGILFADGSVQVRQSLNGGAETASARSGPAPLAAAWNATVLRINDRSNADSGSGAFQQVRVGAGSAIGTIVAARAA